MAQHPRDRKLLEVIYKNYSTNLAQFIDELREYELQKHGTDTIRRHHIENAKVRSGNINLRKRKIVEGFLGHRGLFVSSSQSDEFLNVQKRFAGEYLAIYDLGLSIDSEEDERDGSEILHGRVIMIPESPDDEGSYKSASFLADRPDEGGSQGSLRLEFGYNPFTISMTMVQNEPERTVSPAAFVGVLLQVGEETAIYGIAVGFYDNELSHAVATRFLALPLKWFEREFDYPLTRNNIGADVFGLFCDFLRQKISKPDGAPVDYLLSHPWVVRNHGKNGLSSLCQRIKAALSTR